MANLIGGLILTIIGMIILGVMFGPMSEIINPAKGSDVFNCPGYVSTIGTNTSYNSSLSGNTNTFGCQTINLMLPGVGIAFIVVGIMTMLYGSNIPREF